MVLMKGQNERVKLAREGFTQNVEQALTYGKAKPIFFDEEKM